MIGPLSQPGTTVWVGISCKGGTWTYFFHTTITHNLYLSMLRVNILPQSQSFFFQQDGVPPHCVETVCEFPNEQLPNKWIGQ